MSGMSGVSGISGMSGQEDVGSRPAVTLPDTQARRLRAAANGMAYRIGIWIPPGTPPPGGFPAVYLLDADALFGTFVEAIRRSSRRPDATGIGPAAVIGIAHDDGQPVSARYRDYTTPPAAGQADVPDEAGGADAFLSFIADELVPGLQHELPLDASRRVLFGHSLAGYFVLHAMTTRPLAFGTYAAISPSIWWDESRLRSRLHRMSGSGARVFVAVGEREGEEREGEVRPWQRRTPDLEARFQRRAARRMIANARALAGNLRKLLGDHDVAFHLFPEEDHASVLMIAVQRLLRFSLAPDGNHVA